MSPTKSGCSSQLRASEDRLYGWGCQFGSIGLLPSPPARPIVGLQIAKDILHPRRDVLEQGLDGVDLFVVAVRFVEYPAVALAPDPAERVVAVRARVLLLGLVFRAHLRVVDAGENAQVLAGVGGAAEGIGFVDNHVLLAAERGIERVLRLVDLHRDRLAVVPVKLEEA